MLLTASHELLFHCWKSIELYLLLTYVIVKLFNVLDLQFNQILGLCISPEVFEVDLEWLFDLLSHWSFLNLDASSFLWHVIDSDHFLLFILRWNQLDHLHWLLNYLVFGQRGDNLFVKELARHLLICLFLFVKELLNALQLQFLGFFWRLRHICFLSFLIEGILETLIVLELFLFNRLHQGHILGNRWLYLCDDLTRIGNNDWAIFVLAVTARLGNYAHSRQLLETHFWEVFLQVLDLVLIDKVEIVTWRDFFSAILLAIDSLLFADWCKCVVSWSLLMVLH